MVTDQDEYHKSRILRLKKKNETGVYVIDVLITGITETKTSQKPRAHNYAYPRYQPISALQMTNS